MRAWGWGVALLCLAGTAAAGERIEAKFLRENHRLDFAFPDSMQTLTLQDGAPLVTLSPAIEVTGCTWENDTRLACELARKAPNATRFVATLSPKLQTTSGATLPTRTIAVETERPRVSASIRNWKAGDPVLRLQMTQDSPIASLKASLRLTLDGKPAPVDVAEVEGPPSSARMWELRLPKVAKETTLVLSVVPGLVSPDGPLRGTQDQVLVRAIVGEPFSVRGAVCAGPDAPITAPLKDGRVTLVGCAPGEDIRVLLSRQVAGSEFEAGKLPWPDGVRVQGSGIAYSWHREDALRPVRAGDAYLELAIDAPRTSHTLEIPALSAHDDDDTAKLAPAQLHIETSAPRPALIAPHARALLRRDADPWMEAVNAPPVKIETLAMGRDDARTSMQSPNASDTVVPIDIADMRAALAEGGYASVSPQRNGAATVRDDRLQASAPDFDVYARVGSRQVLVWANAWDDDAPIAGARATLLFDDRTAAAPREIAVARTDAEGVAMLSLPDTFVLPKRPPNEVGPDWYVRIEQGRGRGTQRAVLPLETNGYTEDAFASAPQEMAWGVVDRPLYRAGETVQWKLWLRELHDGRHQAPGAPVKRALRLSKERWGDQSIASWDTTFDAAGEASGSTTIPIHATDGEYCIGARELGAVCFHVGDFRAQDMWVRASTPQKVVRPNDVLDIDFESGFYSGGSAAGIRIDDVQASVSPATLDAAWPQWRGFRFAREHRYRAWDVDTESLSATTDASGRARVRMPIADLALPFAQLFVTAEARPEDREGTTSNNVSAWYARFDRYVGLKVEPQYLRADGPVTLTAVVVDAQGREVADQRVDILVSFRDDDGGAHAPLHTCKLVSSKPTDCTFPRTKTGTYVIEARSGDAAPTDAEFRIWSTGPTTAKKEAERLRIERVEGSTPVAGKPLRLEVRSPVVPMRALLLVSRGKDVIDRRVVHLSSPTQLVEVPTAADWPRDLSATIVARRLDMPRKDALPAGFRAPVALAFDDTDIELGEPEAVAPPVTVTFAPPEAAPAQTVRVIVRNDSAKRRGVTLAIADDALRALGAQWAEEMDPTREGFRHERDWRDGSNTSFATWNANRLRWLLKPDASGDCVAHVLGDCMIAVVGTGAINPIDVSSVESTTIVTAEQIPQIPYARTTTDAALLAPGTAAPAPPAGNVALGYSADADAQELSAVAFDDTEILGNGSMPDPVVAPGQIATPSDTDAVDYGAALARIRSNFAQTALWRTDIVLAPGESKAIDVAAPDNLTRWRATAWSHDDGDDFAMADATLAVGLPVEARLQSPVRLYPGDTARLAANVRQTADHDANAQVRITIDDGTRKDERTSMLALPANGQASTGTTVAPTTTGEWRVTAAAATADGRDAVGAPIEIASTAVLGTKTQAGWVGASPLSLALPTLPAGAHDAHLDVSVWRGASALVSGWTTDLRDYPHRCWEQILSRAVAAALAIERGDTSWPDAKAVVQEALDNAATFQSEYGGMLYFNGAMDSDLADPTSAGLVQLTAYTVDAFGMLRSLGYAVPEDVEGMARAFLIGGLWDKNRGGVENEKAFALSVADLPEARRATLAKSFGELALPAKVAAARAFARTNAPQARGAFESLLLAAPLRGGARSLDPRARFDVWMSSPMREQCELIRLLEDYPQYAPQGARSALIAGLGDLYAGGVAAVDTQTGAMCLRALRKEGGDDASRIIIDFGAAAKTERVTVDAGATQAKASMPMLAGDALTIAAVERPDAPVAYLARIAYTEDARQAQASAMGFSLSRAYEVKRGTRWVAASGEALREGDWVRITLTIRNGDQRWFVAVTDDLPGGLRPIDMDLAGVAGASTATSAQEDESSWFFDERKLDARKPKFYARALPPGEHRIRYFARVANTGDYLAAPAVAELMYGEASRARTAADRLTIPAAEGSAQPGSAQPAR